MKLMKQEVFALTGIACLAVLLAAPSAFGDTVTFNAFGNETTWRNAAGNTIIDTFESYTPYGVQIPELPALGIRFEELDGGGYPRIYNHAGSPYGLQSLANFPNGINETNRWDDVVITVLPGRTITAMGYWNTDGQFDTLVATAYDADGQVLGSIGAYTGQFAGFVSNVPVARVVLDGNSGDGWNSFDGLQTNVPEPATLGLLAMGGVSLLRWRRDQR